MWVAFVAPGNRLMIIRAYGNHPRPRPVGLTRVVTVDWQPQPPVPNPGCAPPPGSPAVASTPTALVAGHGPSGPAAEGFELSPPIAYMGCLRADGRERLLERFFGNNSTKPPGSHPLRSPLPTRRWWRARRRLRYPSPGI